jgi:heptosyltransferase-1
MKVLIVKTSSLGDVIHTLPALTDAALHHPGITFDWVVEESFAEISKWHPNVQQVIPVAWRRWRKNLAAAWHDKQPQQFYQSLRLTQYDAVIDAQGLLKSAFITKLAKGLRYGLDYHSAREPLAALLYQRRIGVPKNQHAVMRTRQLFAQVLNYALPTTQPNYAIRSYFNAAINNQPNNILLVHGTTWTTKEWPEAYWIALANRCIAAGWHVQIPWGNAKEKARAARIAATHATIEVLPKTSLAELASLLLQAKAIVAVDTGIGHLAAALDVPAISLYGPTDPAKIATCGKNQIHLKKSEHMQDLLVEEVWQKLKP